MAQQKIDAQNVIDALQRQLAEKSYQLAVAQAQVAQLTAPVNKEATESPKGEGVADDDQE